VRRGQGAASVRNRGVFDALADVLFPPACAACGRLLRGQAFFCAECEDDVARLPDNPCTTCAEPGHFPGGRCPRCTARPPPFSRAFAPFAHEGAIARAVHQFKYEDHPELARPLAKLLSREAARFLQSAPGCVCAVPLHRSRLHRRRYDQAELLTRELAILAGRERLEALTRTRATQRQVGLSELARVANVAGAFIASKEVRGRDVLLVDDVFTTGATARAAASALLAAGARSVQVLALARAFTL
jgi:ComF family protein